MVLDTKGTRLHYVPGDHVAIYPQYNAKLVSELLDRLTLPCGPDDPIYVECRRESSLGGLPTWSEERRLPVPITLCEAFTYYLDITTPPTPQFLKLLAQQATKMTDQEELLTLAKGGNEYEDWKYDRFPNLIDVMNQFHSLKIDITLLLQQLPLLQCVSGHPLFPFLFTSCVWFEWFCFPSPQRYYSISSSPRMHPGEVHATVAIVSFRKRGIYPNSQGLEPCCTLVSISHFPCGAQVALGQGTMVSAPHGSIVSNLGLLCRALSGSKDTLIRNADL